VAALEDQVDNALNETRMLILGAQVLLGFEFQATFQPVYERLPAPVQELKVISLGLMLLAVGLLIAPGAFHQIVERGNDSPRVIEFTGQIAFLALFPFALGIGLNVYVAAQVVLGPAAALAAGVGATGLALIFWYGLEWVWRARRPQRARSPKWQEDSMADQSGTRLETKIKHVLTEARVVLPGAQALLGFQLAAMLMDSFEKLPKASQYVHLASLGLMSACIVLLMAPAAFHRIVEHGEDTERLHHFSSAMVLTAMVPLAFGIAGDFYVVLQKVLDSTSVAVAGAAASLVFFFGLWFGLTLALRAQVSGLSSPAVR
jgi:hypothetical protein